MINMYILKMKIKNNFLYIFFRMATSPFDEITNYADNSKPATKPSSFPILKIVMDNIRSKLPTRKTEVSAGLNLASTTTITIGPGETKSIPTGIRIELPEGHIGLIKDKPSRAYYDQLHILAGVIDEDFRGEIRVIMHNLSDRIKLINAGARCAQLVIVPSLRPKLIVTSSLRKTNRDKLTFIREEPPPTECILV